MATTTLYLVLGSKLSHGGRHVDQGTSANFDVSLAVNLATVTNKGDIRSAVEQMIAQLPDTVK